MAPVAGELYQGGAVEYGANGVGWGRSVSKCICHRGVGGACDCGVLCDGRTGWSPSVGAGSRGGDMGASR
eukprot:3768014-Pyramimonas_sp.AAC.1